MTSKASSTKKIFIKNLANALTIFRALAGFPLIIALCYENLSAAWILLFIAGLTDIADGWLARKAGTSSKWGARLDPLADKILLSAPLIWLVKTTGLPAWSVWLLLARELFISEWRSHDSSGGPASTEGKIKTLMLFTSIHLMIWPQSWGGVNLIRNLNNIGFYLYWPMLLIAFYSAIKYIKISNRN